MEDSTHLMPLKVFGNVTVMVVTRLLASSLNRRQLSRTLTIEPTLCRIASRAGPGRTSSGAGAVFVSLHTRTKHSAWTQAGNPTLGISPHSEGWIADYH